MRMAKSIANEIISYKVIPQSLPKIKFWQNQLSWGDAAIESGTSKNHYSICLLFCIGACINVTLSVFFISASGEKTERQKIDWRASLATDDQRELFDKLKDFGESIKELKRIFDEVEYFCFPKQNTE